MPEERYFSMPSGKYPGKTMGGSPDQQSASNQNKSCRRVSGPSHQQPVDCKGHQRPQKMFSKLSGGVQAEQGFRLKKRLHPEVAVFAADAGLLETAKGCHRLVGPRF